jgi:alpha-galactosidase
VAPNYITPLTGEKPGWRYGSDLAIYTERFIDGRLLSAAYVDNGVPLYDAEESTDTAAFDLVIDGEALYFGWELAGFESTTEASGVAHAVLTLRHTLKPVTLKITTRACGHGFFRRTIEITNTSPDASLGLTAITPLRGVLWGVRDNLREHLRDQSVPPYSVGRFVNVHWGNEGHFDWQDVPLNTEIGFGSRSGRSGHGCPFFVARNNLYGGFLVAHLGWSSNWKATFFTDFNDNTGRVCLRYELRPDAAAPMRIIAPGETIQAPEVHFGFSHADLDTAIQNLHAYLRESVLKTVGDGLQPVIYNHWSYMEHELSEPALIAEIDIAAEVGAELFIVDAGWFGDKGTNWGDTTGDWMAGDRLPHDLFPVFEHARRKGLKYGLWVEIESAGAKSKLAQAHPDWFIRRYGKPVERILDLAKPEVAAHVEAEIVRIIERYELDLFRLDYNVASLEGGFNRVAGRDENTLWRQSEAVYAIFDRIARRFPHLQLENCASGGGRTDVGIVSRFTTTWVSDWMRLPRTVRILNGMSLALPPEYIDRLAGVAMEASTRGSLDALMHVPILAHPTISGLTPALAAANPAALACVRKYVDIYKTFIRPFHREARVYHHTPVIPGSDGNGWCALEYVSADRRRAVAGVFRLTPPAEPTYHLKFRGLDSALDYRLTVEPGGQTAVFAGRELAQTGLEIRLGTALTSQLLLLTSVAADHTAL